MNNPAYADWEQYRVILAVPFQRLSLEGVLFCLSMLGLSALAVWQVQTIFFAPQIADGFTPKLSLCWPLALWVLGFTTFAKQNHPQLARIMPLHLRRLREISCILWAICSILGAYILCTDVSSFIWSAVGFGLLLLIAALIARRPALLILAMVADFLYQYYKPILIPSGMVSTIQSIGNDIPTAIVSAIALGSFVFTGWCVSRLMQTGDATHIRTFTKKERVAAAMQGSSIKPWEADEGWSLGKVINAPILALRGVALNRFITSEITPLARAEVVFLKDNHWIVFLTGNLVVYGILVLALALIVSLNPTVNFKLFVPNSLALFVVTILMQVMCDFPKARRSQP